MTSYILYSAMRFLSLMCCHVLLRNALEALQQTLCKHWVYTEAGEVSNLVRSMLCGVVMLFVTCTVCLLVNDALV